MIAVELSAEQKSAVEHWVGTWAASPCAPFAGGGDIPKMEFKNQTLRVIVHTSIGGELVRVRLSNTFGTEPLKVDAAHLALRAVADAIVPATDRTLTFGGQSSITIPAGALVLSDAVKLTLPALADVAVSIQIRQSTKATAVHYGARQTSYVADGDQAGETKLASARTLNAWPFVSGIDIAVGESAGAIVALGSSITDGAKSTPDANHRWTDELAVRLQKASPELGVLGVLNEGIGGNRVLHDGAGTWGPVFGKSAMARFDRDVIAQAGVKYLVITEGGNDISHPGAAAPMSEAVSAQEIIAGLEQLTERAHEHGIHVMGGTLSPFERMTVNIYTPEREAIRNAVNQWIRTTKSLDGVVDFDKVLQDPSHPSRLLPKFDSGDHLHPNDAGYKAMGDAIDLRFFSEVRR
jgi:lysophospholipase L1-like esterase